MKRNCFGIPIELIKVGGDRSRYRSSEELRAIIENTDDTSAFLGIVEAVEDDEVDGHNDFSSVHGGQIEDSSAA